MSAVTAGMAPHENLHDSGNPPRLLSKLEFEGSVPEGEPIHLDIRVASESEVKVDWLKDGKKLMSGSRINESYDRGYASLDIQYTYPEDSGVYSVTVSNHAGRVDAEPIEITVISEEAEQYETVEMQNAAFDSMPSRFATNDTEAHGAEPPNFTKNVTCLKSEVFQGNPTRFITEVKPNNDPSMKIEWFRDGQPLVIGSRVSSFYDRGLCVLDIAYCYPEDSGNYICVATSKSGSNESSSASLSCEADAKIITKSNLTDSSINQLKQLEQPDQEYGDFVDNVEPIPPSFKSSIIPPQLTTFETCDAYFEVPVDTGNGLNVNLEWKRDGKIVNFSSLVTGKLEMGKASLTFNYTQPSDAGKYVCCVSTEYGACESEPAELVITTTGVIVSESQLKGNRAETGLQALKELEDLLNAPRTTTILDDAPPDAPTILTQPQAVGDVIEGQSVDFRLQFEPATDPNIVVQWYKDKEALSNGTG